jgi:hypothetical protein
MLNGAPVVIWVALLVAVLILATVVGLLARRNGRFNKDPLHWPSTSSYRFIQSCSEYLKRSGWNVDQRVGSYFHLFAQRKEMTAHITCRPSGFEVDAPYLRDLISWKMRYRLDSAIAITHDPVSREQTFQAAEAGILLLHYKELDSLLDRLVRLRSALTKDRIGSGVTAQARDVTMTEPDRQLSSRAL